MPGLPSPPSFDVKVQGLTISPPPGTQRIPLIPFTVNLPENWFGKKRVQRKLLDNVSLTCKKGEVLAIIGGSGSGKSTLLSSLAARLANLEMDSGEISFIPRSSGPSVSGGLRISKEHKHPRGISKIVGYVKQDPSLLPYLTVRETLETAAALRLPSDAPASIVAEIVQQTLNELGLEEQAETIVGAEGGRGWGRKAANADGVSSSHHLMDNPNQIMRRLSIGCVMVTRPSVLLLDEPTTGLDAFSSYQLLSTLSQLSRRGRTIILSIHQPRSEAFKIFDRLAVLTKGSLVYAGATKDVMSYFRSVGHKPLLKQQNPLDWVIDLSSVDTRDDDLERESTERVEKLKEEWRKKADYSKDSNHEPSTEAKASSNRSSLEKEPLDEMSTYVDPEKRVSSVLDDKYPLEDPSPIGDIKKDQNDELERFSSFGEGSELIGKRPSWWRQTIVLTRRALLNVLRNYGQTAGFFIQTIIMAVVIGAAFYQLPENPGGIQSIKTLCYFVNVMNYYLLLMVYTFVLCSEFRVFDYEREDGLYGTLPYLVAINLAYLPINVIAPTVYSIIVYFMTGLRKDDLAYHFCCFMANHILQQIASFGYGLVSAATSRSFARASLVGNSSSIVLLLTAGYVLVDVPVYIKWARWISPYYYGFHWLATSQFEDRRFACKGITGPAANQCIGENVLIGMKINGSIPDYAWPLGILAFCTLLFTISFILLQWHHPGGVKHARARYTDEAELKRTEKTSLQELESQRTRDGIKVSVEHLRLSVIQKAFVHPKESKEKVILDECFGEFMPGKVTAVMGPSGAGKSSLLQLLAGQLQEGAISKWKCEGSIKFNEHAADNHRNICGFVEQSDKHLLPALTVRETLLYAAVLKLRNMTKRQKAARAEQVLRMLGLKECADNLVGGDLIKGISGGEKRRLSLAIQLLSDPPVIVADEPLSGLDSFIARNIMECLSAIARSGRTVIISIHQPLFWGPKDEALPTFASIGLECPKDYNPADFLIDAISINKRTKEDEHRSSKRLSQMLDVWSQQISFASKTSERQPANDAVIAHDTKSAPMRYALPTVISRSWKNMRRQPDVFPVRAVNPPFLALIFWFFYQRLSLGPTGSQNRIGLFQQNSALQFVGMLSSMAIYPNERNLFLYEWSSTSRYSPETFLLSYTAIELPFQVIASLLYAIIFIYGMDLQHTPRIFFEYFTSCWALISVGESIGIVFSTFVENGGLSVSLVSSGTSTLSFISQAKVVNGVTLGIALSTMAIISGIVSANVPTWFQAIAWVAVIKISSRIQIINEMIGLRFNCTQDQIANGQCLACQYSITLDSLLSHDPYLSQAPVLDTLSIKDRNTGKFIGIMMAVVVAYRLAALAALRIKVRYL
ncbi:P-loop containing nucleoside triphosphate hydrolase protein [Atractiella rhizophila]|nr:P-loop containing nucleoside triphosphate hydrolase protein [Atractiella rhizophila]